MTDARDLLFELGTEELPPKHLAKLANSLAEQVEAGLEKVDLNFSSVKWYATPRRLTVYINELQVKQEAKEETRRGPALAAAYDQDGNPTKAAEGFARSCGTTVEQLQELETDKGKWLAYEVRIEGLETKTIIADIINQALKKLPIAKRMRWGNHETEFVRPVHWSLLLFGEESIAADILGTQSGQISYGHRFHSPAAINIKQASDYVESLKASYVLVDYDERRARIKESVEQLASEHQALALIDEGLLDEVTSINEWPVALVGHFDESFLELPKEVLIASMQDHQKYFPLQDKEGTLLPSFITIANIESKNIDSVRSGNERVLSPRLSDAQFFWQQDLKQKLEAYFPKLEDVLYQKQLGSLGDKVERVSKLAKHIATQLNADVTLIERAVKLSKCDLLTDMVGEFPELQGTIGFYYARKNGEAEEVALALDEQYMPRFAGDALPSKQTGQILSLSEKLDTILGIFSIGQIPSGDKDPFALRRNALGALRIIIERELALDLMELLQFACGSYQHKFDHDEVSNATFAFMMDRLRAYYLDNGIDSLSFESVLARRPTQPLDYHQRLAAVMDFQKLAEAADLAAANKRIGNILKKADTEIPSEVNVELLNDQAEKQLAEQLSEMETTIAPLYAKNNYCEVLQSLAKLRDPIDQFFDEVMVMTDDESVKSNRLALLNSVSHLFLKTADISKLQSTK